jgi:hypothetical protein
MAKHRSVFLQVSEKSMVDHPFFMMIQLLWAEKRSQSSTLWKKKFKVLKWLQPSMPSYAFVFYKCCSRASHSGP